MRAITLWQPYASLVAEGVKTIETRSWSAPADLIGERIAIHAAKRKPPTVFESANGGGLPDWFPADISDRPSLYGRGEETADGWWFAHQWTGPLGAVVATATLTACVPMVDLGDPFHGPCVWIWPGDDDQETTAGYDLRGWEESDSIDVTDQLPYGDFAPGRWAWMLDDIAPTTERCPACDGTGQGGPFAYDDDPYYLPPSMGGMCSICNGAKVCDPIPWRGRQRVWRWEP